MTNSKQVRNPTAESTDLLAYEMTAWRDAGGPAGEVVCRIMDLIDTRIISSRHWPKDSFEHDVVDQIPLCLACGKEHASLECTPSAKTGVK